MSDNTRHITIPESYDSSVLYPLSRIVNDLWGVNETAQSKPQSIDQKKQDDKATALNDSATHQKSFPEFGKLWIVADEMIEWTEALVHAECPDGMMPPETWTFLHEQAEKVLNGDAEAYRTVLQHCAPLADLASYAASFDVAVLDADTLDVTFECIPAYMGNDQASLRRYVSGLSLRVARDLLALLPATKVHVCADFVGTTLLDVSYSREYLRNLRFGFIDPETAAKDVGGVFAGNQ